MNISLSIFFIFILALFVVNSVSQQLELADSSRLEGGSKELKSQKPAELAEQSETQSTLDQGDVKSVSTKVEQSTSDLAESVDSTHELEGKLKTKRGAPYLDQITGLVPSLDDKFLSYQAILQRWGVDYQKEPFILACEFAEVYGLRCLHNSGNWRSLLKLDRPAVLTLTNEFGQSLYFTLLAIEGQDALVSHQGDMYWVGMDELDRYWLGEYTVLWKLPPYKSRVVMPGQELENEWLEGSLSRLGRSYNGTNEPLDKKIQRFQQSTGLIPDGIPGTMTLIHINKRLCLDCPKLLGGM